jgi:hypothetical protein
MEKARSFFAILGLGITIGVVVVVFLVFVVRVIPKSIIIGGVEFEIPTPTLQNQEPISSNLSTKSVLQPTSVPDVPSVPIQSCTIENLGLWEWGKSRPPMPEPAGIDQVIFAHGDIDNSGTCHVKEFGRGMQVDGLGDGTFRLVRITCAPEQIAAAELEIQQIAANGAGGSCPWK